MKEEQKELQFRNSVISLKKNIKMVKTNCYLTLTNTLIYKLKLCWRIWEDLVRNLL